MIPWHKTRLQSDLAEHASSTPIAPPPPTTLLPTLIDPVKDYDFNLRTWEKFRNILVSKHAQFPNKSEVVEMSLERSVIDIDGRGYAKYHEEEKALKDELMAPELKLIADKFSQAEEGSLTHYVGECAIRML